MLAGILDDGITLIQGVSYRTVLPHRNNLVIIGAILEHIQILSKTGLIVLVGSPPIWIVDIVPACPILTGSRQRPPCCSPILQRDVWLDGLDAFADLFHIPLNDMRAPLHPLVVMS